MAEQLLHTANGRGDGGDGSDGVSGVAEMNKAIQAFVTEHNGTPSLLAAGVSEAQKTRLVQLLIDCASQHGYDITTTWSALRICSRDPQGMGPVLTQTGLQTLLSCVEEHHEAECLKVLINLAITSPGLLQPLVAHLKVLEVLERTAANVSAPSGSESAAAFAPLLMKAIFVLLASYPPLHHELMSLNRLQPFVDTVTTHTTTQPDFAAEALKVLFVVCSGWWKTAPLDPPLIATISAITASLAPWLWHAIRSSPLRAPLLRAALEFLVAVPPPCLPAVEDDDVDRGVDPISGRRATREPVQWSSEEEKERTAHELLSLIDRLNKLGVIRCNLPHPDDMPDAGGDDGDGDGDGEEGGLSSS
ncbi:hypothetical protein PTSG_09294 [Salpingoeca rosetta]|uniref:Uncharacterized protein n=1 Tax=Salpingoeca rosetta (strain ATCC 50818 / BSB-021) TaxID=946362 RepID=F2UM78_SALR5|nr:uncharacterized protein PTSG_09294 [Salpingoeca rosetta]EGD78227.1 hypothetical protein PTSG_09294 [Salpingoeca rosetta]|eukprot:XP_004989550.1 hypothetical protein PTSG_09294 [Salpingoeca rosetta]